MMMTLSRFASETGGENRKLKSEKRNEEAGIKHIGRSILVRCVEDKIFH